MALYYTPPSLPRAPSSCTMNASLPSLSSDLLATWSSWRQPKLETPLTPPMSAVPHSRTMSMQTQPMTLPPITSFVTPMTPPHSQEWRQLTPPRLPTPDVSYHQYPETNVTIDSMNELPVISEPTVADAPQLVDWLDNTLKRPVSFVAEKTCEMICYLWFATSLPAPSGGSRPSTTHHSPTYSPKTHSSTTALQLVASPNFVTFMQKVLETTQVGQSVIVLSLHYIYRLKERNCLTTAQSGSEYRIAVAALMMANKFLDDNTYTNKTWSDVSGITLEEVSRMEREFLLGIDFNLYVDQDTYESWRDLLKGLVMAKEKDRLQWRRSSRIQHRSSTRPINPSSAAPASRSYSSRYRGPTHRARSTSPTDASRTFNYAFDFTAPSYTSLHMPTHAPPPEYSPTPRPGSKRQANAAFSPTSETFTDPRPLKRPTSMSLEIPAYLPSKNSNSTISPLESLQSFAKMSLASSSPSMPYTPQTNNSSPNWITYTGMDVAPKTLVAPYRVEKPAEMPQNLYYYSLAGSAAEEEEESNWRKAKLRCHQPPPPPTYVAYHQPQRLMPMNIQSASTSPHELHMSAVAPPPTLPHFHETMWSHPPAPTTLDLPAIDYMNHESRPQYYNSISDSPIPTAPFANAGPPGFQFYTHPVQQQPSPLHSYSNWPRGRRL